MTMGYSAVALPSLANGTSGVYVVDDSATWFASLPIIATPLGSVISLITMKAGRRVAIASSTSVCTISWITIACSYDVPQLLFGRILGGVAIGLVSTPSAVYVAEISSPNITTVLTALTALTMAMGVSIVYFLGYVTQRDWRMTAILSSIAPFFLTAAIIISLPESPRWLLSRKRHEDARKALLRLRGLKQETESFKEEFADMISNSLKNYEAETSTGIGQGPTFVPDPGASQTGIPTPSRIKDSGTSIVNIVWKKSRDILRIIKIPEVWKPFIILNMFFFFQQFCGIYVLIAYSVDLISNTGITQDPYVITVFIGLIQLVASITLVSSSTRIGRRSIAMISGVGMSVSLAVLGVYNQFFRNDAISGLPLACILFFIAAGSFGFASLPWAMIGELYPTRYVSILGPITTCFAGFYQFATVQLYPTFIQYDAIGTIYFYCAISVAATIFVVFTLPETMGKSKTEIEARFKGIS
ncbi:facilitated trehalose transporter Tret1-2 homolog isoform X2 [Cephus cinctus]|nr:facilitated trehalose transporter Tret1-2 homolog isoform X2 [Cephus cinctus]XP_024944353.1 facilitated trehalose transporter Tret1-2 homolog isoform X2 [Cephus cinctus]